MFSSRLQTLRKKLNEQHAFGIVITNPKNIFYLTDFKGLSPQERESSLFVSQKDAVLFLPQMYAEDGDACASVQSGHVRVDSDIRNFGLLGSFVNYSDEKESILFEEDNLTVREHRLIKERTKRSLHPASPNPLLAMRKIKDEKEIAAMRKAANITDLVFSQICEYLQKKITDPQSPISETHIADKLLEYGKQAGADDFGFPPIVAFGANAAKPHYHTSNTTIQPGGPMLIDMGFLVDGYTSDFTRTIFIGKAPNKFKKHYQLVRENNEACIKKVIPGAFPHELFSYSYDLFEQKKLGQYYLHSLGHGIGLNIHESPGLGRREEEALQGGNMITIEPGLYFAGEYGIRVEDLLLVTEDGHEVLSKATKDLIEIY